jgi:hypothetical protein
MKRIIIGASFAVLAIAHAAHAWAADGKLTGLKITPAQPFVGDSVSVKFEGQGTCAGPAVIVVHSQPPGQTMQHKVVSGIFAAGAPWPRVAAFVPDEKIAHWITMAPPDDLALSSSNGCYGSPAGVSNMVSTKAKPTLQTAGDVGTVDPGPAPEKCPKPTIKSLMVGGAVKPGSAIIIGGCGFGAQKGEVRLVGKFEKGYFPLKIDTWGPGGVGVFVPKSITGGPDQDAAVVVITKDGKQSNADKKVKFIAKRVQQTLTLYDTKNTCKKSGGLYGLEFESICASTGQNYGGKTCKDTVCVLQKGKNVMNNVLHYGGPDEYQLKLKNGWVYEDVKFWSNSGADFALPYTPPVGPKPKVKVIGDGADAKVRVDWEAFRPTGWVEYKLKIYVTGPAGVPWE